MPTAELEDASNCVGSTQAKKVAFAYFNLLRPKTSSFVLLEPFGVLREQAATVILAKQIPLVVAGSLPSIFARNSINNALLGLEVPRHVGRLRTAFPSSEKVLARRTDWILTWDISRSTVKVQQGKDGECWEGQVGQFPDLPGESTRVHRTGGLTEWVKHKIAKVAV
ncbi:Aconitase/3-isopropylmalate dehydratase [Xylaria telfairii]|nr:Aconitase/3-isopropylmalate dehydratase [Xylaria telfairii]